MPTLYRPHRPETINRALLNLRAQIVREDGKGLRHVNALLRLRGIDPDSQHVPEPLPSNRFRRSELKRLIVRTLRSVPHTGRELAAAVASHRPGVDPETLYRRVCASLTLLHRAGAVRNGNGVWWLPNRQ